MMRVRCYTSFTFAYAARALVLAETVRRIHPEWTLAAVLVDVPPPDADAAGLLQAFDEVVPAAQLGIPRFANWLFKHDVVEACTAVKGAMMQRLLAQPCDAAVYLDPDIAVFSRLEEMEAALASASVVLTPHQTAPNLAEPALVDNEMASLIYGAYNLGFLAVRNDAGGRAFADWWAAMLRRACYDDPASGLFTDQRYMDLAPGLFDGVRVLRAPGCNVASWNLSNRRITIRADGAIRANGEMLRFFHFTKVNGLGDVMLERYAGDNVEVFELLAWYKRRLVHHGAHPAAALPWHYGQFSNGIPIPKAARVVFRSRPDLIAHFGDPFDAEAPESYLGWLRAEHPEMLA